MLGRSRFAAGCEQLRESSSQSAARSQLHGRRRQLLYQPQLTEPRVATTTICHVQQSSDVE